MDNQTTNRYDVIYVGNYTKDTIITPDGTRYVDGGAVNYAAHAAARLGYKTAVVTRLAREDKRMIEFTGIGRGGLLSGVHTIIDFNEIGL